MMSWIKLAFAAIRLSHLAYYKRFGFAITGSVLPFALGVIISVNARSWKPMEHVPADVYVLTGFMGYAVLFVVYNLVNSVTIRRDALIYRRLRSTALPDSAILVGEGLTMVAIAWVVVAAMAVFGGAALGAGFPHNIALLVFGVLAGSVMFAALAVGVAGVMPSAETSVWIVTPVLVVMMMTSGVFTPISGLPLIVRYIGEFLPLTPVVNLIRIGYVGTSPGSEPVLVSVACMAGWLVAGLVLAKTLFRWDPRRGR